MASADRKALVRNKIADYIKVGDKFELMGTGFKSVNESPSAQTDSTTYINETSSSTDIIGYETELWKDGRDHHTGGDAQHEYVRVDLYNPIGNPTETAALFKARKFIVANEVSDYEGDGGEKISVSGTLHAVGDPIQGKFDTVTKTFTAGDFKGAYDA